MSAVHISYPIPSRFLLILSLNIRLHDDLLRTNFQNYTVFISLQRAWLITIFSIAFFGAEIRTHKPDHCVPHHSLLLRISDTQISTISSEQRVT